LSAMLSDPTESRISFPELYLCIITCLIIVYTAPLPLY